MITNDADELLAFFDYPCEHWVHLRTTNPIGSTFATVRHRTKITKDPARGRRTGHGIQAHRAAAARQRQPGREQQLIFVQIEEQAVPLGAGTTPAAPEALQNPATVSGELTWITRSRSPTSTPSSMAEVDTDDAVPAFGEGWDCVTFVQGNGGGAPGMPVTPRCAAFSAPAFDSHRHADTKAEHELFARIGELFADRWVLLISHRVSTVRSADRIYVLSDGCVLESGAHEELLAAAGIYAELFTLQASPYQ